MLKDITLSSIELKPNNELFLTSFKHWAHRCTELFVSESTNGKIQNDNQPSANNKMRETRYPRMLF